MPDRPQRVPWAWLLAGVILAVHASACAEVVFEAQSPYHHILVIDDRGQRVLSFDGTQETRMSLRDPLQGHFGYTELFHYAWLWNTNISRVLMLGLGGGSSQRSFLHRYPRVQIQSVEIDPIVVQVATNFFHVPISERHRVQVEDGRVFLRRSREVYDLIILDAYVKHRYGSQIPQHLATREFFELAKSRLGTHGVLAYNVITVSRLGGRDAAPALARTLLAVFPQVYTFQAQDSLNAVLIATRETRRWSHAELVQRATQLTAIRLNAPPGLLQRVGSYRTAPPAGTPQALVLTDDFAPVESLDRR